MRGLLEGDTAEERMGALCQFIEHWVGPRHPEYGIPAERIRDLPWPLFRFYEFAGLWPRGDGRIFWSTQDMLVTGNGLGPDRLAYRRIRFINENQGVWSLLTLDDSIAGPDPPVELQWSDGDGRGIELANVSLTDCLVAYAIREMAFNSIRWATDGPLRKLFGAGSDAEPLVLDGRYVWNTPFQAWLWGDILVHRFGTSTDLCFAACTRSGLRFMEQALGPSQGPGT